jgi:membrane-associated phospholipid phosphatase
VPDWLRRWVLFVTVIATACLAGFGFVTRDSSRPVLFDRSVDAFLVRTLGIWHRVAVLLSRVGDPRIFGTATAVVALLLILMGDYRAAVATVASVAIALTLVEVVLKPFFGRDLGSLPGPTFPSGHTAVSAALAGAVILAARGTRPLGRLLGPALRRLLMAIAPIASCTIGLAMVALQFHYVSDVVAGVPLGLAVAGCTAVFLDSVAARWRRGAIANRTSAPGSVPNGLR